MQGGKKRRLRVAEYGILGRKGPRLHGGGGGGGFTVEGEMHTARFFFERRLDLGFFFFERKLDWAMRGWAAA